MKNTFWLFLLLQCASLSAQDTYSFYIALKNGERLTNIKISLNHKETNWKKVSYTFKNDPDKKLHTHTPEEVDSFSTIVEQYVQKTYKTVNNQEESIFVSSKGTDFAPLYQTMDEKGHLLLFVQPDPDKPLVPVPHWNIRSFFIERFPQFDHYVEDYEIGPLRYDADLLAATLTEYAAYLYPDKYTAQNISKAIPFQSGFSWGIRASTGFRQMRFVEGSIAFADDISYTALVFNAGLLCEVIYTPASSLIIAPEFSFYHNSLYPDSINIKRNNFTLPISYRYTLHTGKRANFFAELGAYAGLNAAAEIIRDFGTATKGYSFDPFFGGWQAGIGLIWQQRHTGDLLFALHYSQNTDQVEVFVFPQTKEKVHFSFLTLSLSWRIL